VGRTGACDKPSTQIRLQRPTKAGATIIKAKEILALKTRNQKLFLNAVKSKSSS